MAGRMRGSTARRLTPCVTPPCSNAFGTTQTTRCSMTNVDLIAEARKLAETTWTNASDVPWGFLTRAHTLLPQLSDALEAAEARLAKVQTSCNAIAITIRSGP